MKVWITSKELSWKRPSINMAYTDETKLEEIGSIVDANAYDAFSPTCNSPLSFGDDFLISLLLSENLTFSMLIRIVRLEFFSFDLGIPATLKLFLVSKRIASFFLDNVDSKMLLFLFILYNRYSVSLCRRNDDLMQSLSSCKEWDLCVEVFALQELFIYGQSVWIYLIGYLVFSRLCLKDEPP